MKKSKFWRWIRTIYIGLSGLLFSGALAYLANYMTSDLTADRVKLGKQAKTAAVEISNELLMSWDPKVMKKYATESLLTHMGPDDLADHFQIYKKRYGGTEFIFEPSGLQLQTHLPDIHKRLEWRARLKILFRSQRADGELVLILKQDENNWKIADFQVTKK